MTAVELFFGFISALIIVGTISIVLAFYLFFWLRRLLLLSGRNIQINEDLTRAALAHFSKLSDEKLSKILADYAKKLADAHSKYQEQLAKLAGDSNQQMGDFIKVQQDAIVKSSNLIIERVTVAAIGEINKYKENQMMRVDNEARDLVQRVAGEVLNRAISLEEHEDLARAALVRAREDGIFAAVNMAKKGKNRG